MIAEIERSPSRATLRRPRSAALASTYESGGAACLSVLTDGPTSMVRLPTCKRLVPALRRCCARISPSPNDVLDARLMGADCVLLIAAALDRHELWPFTRTGHAIGLEVLVEIHDEAEAGCRLAGQGHDRRRQSARSRHLRGRSRASGAHGRLDPTRRRAGRRERRAQRADASSLRGAGYDAVLVGESLVTAVDPAAAIAEPESARPPKS